MATCRANPAWAASIAIPETHGATLDGRGVEWPRDLNGPMVLVIGFNQGAADATTAWERALWALPSARAVNFYDVPVVAAAPAFVRPFIVKAIRKQVPLVARPYLVPLTENETEWKRVAAYANTAPNAAYLVVVDKTGVVRWSEREDFSAGNLEHLLERVREVR